jgi:hypothetical protein
MPRHGLDDIEASIAAFERSVKHGLDYLESNGIIASPWPRANWCLTEI